MPSAEETKGDRDIEAPAEEISNKADAGVQQGDRASSEKVEELFEEGYKLFIAQNFKDAADKFSEAKQILNSMFSDTAELCVAIYGDFAEAGYKVHYYYGRALVKNARIQKLQKKWPAIDPKSNTSDDNDVGEHNEEQVSEAKVIVPDAEQNDQGCKTVGIEEPLKSDPIAANIAEEKSVDETLRIEQNDDDGDGSEANNVAWQLLEVARNICVKQEQSKEWLGRTADVRVAVGEWRIVFGSFEKALEEFKAALKIQVQIFERNNRKIVETLNHIGLTHKNNDDFDKAAEFFEKACEVIQKAIEFEVLKLAANDKDSADLLAKLKTLVDDIKERVQDARESALSRHEDKPFVASLMRWGKIKDIVIDSGNNSSGPSSGEGTSDQVVNDISDQVRIGTKRPATTDEPTPATTSKENAGQQMNEEPVDKQLKQEDRKIDD